MADEKKPETGGAEKKNSKVRLIGGAALLCVVAAGGWLLTNQSKSAIPSTVSTASATGVIDVKKAMQAHNAYGQLAALREERERMAGDLAIAQRMLIKLLAPKAEKEPFDAAVRQKSRTEAVHAHGAAMERLNAAEAAEREATKSMLEAARDEINAEYFNEIFNIQLKLDNAKAMRLSEADIEALKERLHDLQMERGRRQIAMWQAYEAKIKEHRAELAAQEGIREAENSAQTTEQFRAQEAAKQSVAQARNLDMMQKKMLDTSKLQARIQERTLALKAKDKEIASLENQVLKEIAGKAAKLAAIHHLSIIYAAPVTNTYTLPAGIRQVGAERPATARIIAVNAQDVTDELIRELQ